NTPFKREKENIFKTEEIDLYTALLGGEITTETFNGKVKLIVKPETQTGTKIKLKGKGFPKYKKVDQFGDLFITYQVVMPTNLSEKEKQLFKELQDRKSTRLNSSHVKISYAVFCLKKKKNKKKKKTTSIVII